MCRMGPEPWGMQISLKLFTVSRTERPKTRTCLAAHPRVAMGYTLGNKLSGSSKVDISHHPT